MNIFESLQKNQKKPRNLAAIAWIYRFFWFRLYYLSHQILEDAASTAVFKSLITAWTLSLLFQY